jgi:NAD/NADP transhydrogenase beta subunit
MPVSKKRKKSVYTPPPPVGGVKKKGPSPVWLAPLMLAMFLIGIAWLITYYLAGVDMPVVGSWGNSNLLVGFGFIVAGFALSTQWR